jgi:hypothetical protein
VRFSFWAKKLFAVCSIVFATPSLVDEAEAHLGSFGYAKTAKVQ